MSRYIQVRSHKVYVLPSAINRVMASCIEQNIVEFTVADDRGGSDHWVITFGPETSREKVRKIVGPGIDIETEGTS